jgi:hypothetical protein
VKDKFQALNFANASNRGAFNGLIAKSAKESAL